jgi:hypothetical protein
LNSDSYYQSMSSTFLFLKNYHPMYIYPGGIQSHDP